MDLKRNHSTCLTHIWLCDVCDDDYLSFSPELQATSEFHFFASLLCLSRPKEHKTLISLVLGCCINERIELSSSLITTSIVILSEKKLKVKPNS